MAEERHKAERAIIMAAGKGKRMQPLTLETPKPLIEVNGVRMIDTIIRGLHANGITEIYVVVGYLKQKFSELPSEYPGLTLIENPYWDTCNNISSLYCAREHLDDCIILDGDQMIYNAGILSREFGLSGYNAVWCGEGTDEWLLEVRNGVIRSCSRTGGSHGWQLYSISRWTREDGKKLKLHVEREFESGNRQIYWDDIAMFCYFDEYRLGIREMKRRDIAEIDGIEELAAIDPSYRDRIDTKDEG